MTIKTLLQKCLDAGKFEMKTPNCYHIEIGMWAGEGYGSSGEVQYRFWHAEAHKSLYANTQKGLIALVYKTFGTDSVYDTRETPDTDFGGSE